MIRTQYTCDHCGKVQYSRSISTFNRLFVIHRISLVIKRVGNPLEGNAFIKEEDWCDYCVVQTKVMSSSSFTEAVERIKD